MTGKYQCNRCGRVHQFEENQFQSDGLFEYIYCSHCSMETKQIWLGDREEDKYLYWNVNVDPRYTEQND